jgi:hypothetical protein
MRGLRLQVSPAELLAERQQLLIADLIVQQIEARRYTEAFALVQDWKKARDRTRKARRNLQQLYQDRAAS